MPALGLGITAVASVPGILDTFGRKITRVRVGTTVHAFMPVAGNPPTAVPMIQWTLNGADLPGATGVYLTVPDLAGTLSWRGTDSDGTPILAETSAEVFGVTAEVTASPVITLETAPTAAGLAPVTAGEDVSTVLGRLTQTGLATTTGTGGVTTVATLLSGGNVVTDLTEGLTLDTLRFSYSATGAEDLVEDVAVSITVQAAQSVPTYRVSTGDELRALTPWTLSTASEPNAKIIVGYGSSITRDDLVCLGGGFSSNTGQRPDPVVLHGKITVVFEDGPNGELQDWSGSRAARYTSAEGVDARDAGIFYEGGNLVTYDDSQNVSLFVLERMAGASFGLKGTAGTGPFPLDPLGDYGCKIDVTGYSGTFQIGEFLETPVWNTTTGGNTHQRRLMEVRDNGDGTHTLLVDDQQGDGQQGATADDVGIGAVLTGADSGATGTTTTVAYDEKPVSMSITSVTGNPRPDHVFVEGCRFEDVRNALTVRGNNSVRILDTTVARYFGDAIQILQPTPGQGELAEVHGCKAINPCDAATDLGNPHADWLQVREPQGGSFWDRVKVTANQSADGKVRDFSFAQHAFVSMGSLGDDGVFECWGNILSGHGNVRALHAGRKASDIVHNNTVFRETLDDGSHHPSADDPAIVIFGTVNLQHNIATKAVTNSGANPTIAASNHFLQLDSDAPYAGPTTDFLAGPFNIATWEDQFAAAANGPSAAANAGARGAPVDWVSKTVTTDHLTPPVPETPDGPVGVYDFGATAPVRGNSTFPQSVTMIPDGWEVVYNTGINDLTALYWDVGPGVLVPGTIYNFTMTFERNVVSGTPTLTAARNDRLNSSIVGQEATTGAADVPTGVTLTFTSGSDTQFVGFVMVAAGSAATAQTWKITDISLTAA